MDGEARDRSPDSTVALFWRGYEFGSRRFKRYASDVFHTRLLLEPAVIMRGADAARVFYDTERFQRHGGLPRRVQKTLVGVGGVQGLDGEAHRSRKRMFMSLMTPEAITALAEQAAQGWRARIPAWERADRVVLFDEVGQILCQAVSDWAGVPVAEAQVRRRTEDLHALIDAPAAVGPRYWRGRIARSRAERGLAGLVERVRSGSRPAPQGTALHAFATHRDPDGQLLDSRIAAVELLNVLRPTVAVDRFIVFATLALHEHPQWRTRLRDGGEQDAELFVQEVRRYYPFFPMVTARARAAFDWQGIHFPTGRRVMLDLYGTNQHPDLWQAPQDFDPDRFNAWDGDAYDFIPQGGGDHYAGHRCPGEWITIALMKTIVGILTRDINYEVPEQDLRIRRRRMPTLPASGLVITDVRRAATAATASTSR